MNLKERLRKALQHEQPDRVPVDFGSNAVIGMHVWIVDKLRDYFGLEKRPVRALEPYQMLEEIENDFLEVKGAL